MARTKKRQQNTSASFLAVYHDHCGFCGHEVFNTDCAYGGSGVLVYTGCLELMNPELRIYSGSECRCSASGAGCC